ncbi:hypothetical protein J3458_022002 [Metarhizium acridum]|uniref:uncharacterized protein n=1 Tax=Metarhizium acridum TaxID=92637 RepID=UPI001C6C69EA|nr:hypothetical protein J3458_022002 [Metarhizium acridum]
MEPAYVNLATGGQGTSSHYVFLHPPQSHVIWSRPLFCLETFLQNVSGRFHQAIVMGMVMTPINPGLIVPRSKVRSTPSVDLKHGIGAATIYSRSSILSSHKMFVLPTHQEVVLWHYQFP